MFFVKQSDYYTPFETHYHERVLAHRLQQQQQRQHQQQLALQRQQVKIQQQRQQQLIRHIQHLNTPEISTRETSQMHHLILSKSVTRANNEYMHPFTGYTLQIEDDWLIVKSDVDNYEETFQLPRDADRNADVQYQIVDEGYTMIISVMKQKQQKPQQRIQQQQPCGREDIPLATVFEKFLSNLAVNGCRDDAADVATRTQKRREMAEVPTTNEGEHAETSPVPEVAEVIEESTASTIEDEPADMLKNYNTTSRRTVFLPNTNQLEEALEEQEEQDEEEGFEIPVNRILKRVHSPTLEDVVDEEFM
jgi:hypothetical protein